MRVSCCPAVTTTGARTLEHAVDHANGIAQAGGNMQISDRGLARRACVIAGRADRDTFVQGDVVLDLWVIKQAVEQRILGRSGVAEDCICAMRDEAVHEYLASAHLLDPPVDLILRDLCKSE